jgi:UDP-glucuronate 4-epimerase
LPEVPESFAQRWFPGALPDYGLVDSSKGAGVRALITGVAGFIGSNLAESLVAEGHQVLGVDSFTSFYDRTSKEDNVAGLATARTFHMERADLRGADLAHLLRGVDVVFHNAGQPGVRDSWSERFADYVTNNVLATQRLLEACRRASVSRVVFASSSSVYGNAASYPARENDLPAPHSPYGVTKLAAEQLCNLYAANWGLPTVALRYFTVYGPRQRPDMAFRRLVEASLTRTAFPLYGTGDQIREFTYVGDVVRANVLAATADVEPGTVLNIGGGGEQRLIDVVDLVGELAGEPVKIEGHPEQPGDVSRTGADITLAHRQLGWEPRTSLRSGLVAQLAWQRARQHRLISR